VLHRLASNNADIDCPDKKVVFLLNFVSLFICYKNDIEEEV